MTGLPFAKPVYSSSNRRRQSEETRLKISKANKGKHLECAPLE
ncbi:MAG: NUMOD3 domain-containing DNA-binding protein [Nitrososphaeraceae archaeon]